MPFKCSFPVFIAPQLPVLTLLRIAGKDLRAFTHASVAPISVCPTRALGPIGSTDSEVVGCVWSNSNENESRCETLGFSKDTVTVFSEECEGLQAQQTAPPRAYPLSSLKIRYSGCPCKQAKGSKPPHIGNPAFM